MVAKSYNKGLKEFLGNQEDMELSTRVTEKDLENAWTDWRGVMYSSDRKRLLKVPSGIRWKYSVMPGTLVICDKAFSNKGYRLLKISLPEGLRVIGEDAFFRCELLNSIMIPDSVTSIESHAFAECATLSKVTIGDSVTSIGDGAFFLCKSLKEVTLGNSVIDIGVSAFCENRSLEKITIPNSVMFIGDFAFEGCYSLNKVTIGDSVMYIGYRAFSGCSSLKRYEVMEGNKYFLSKDGVLYSKNMVELIQFPASSSGPFIIPDHITHIRECAFRYCRNLKEIVIPDSVTSIGESSFPLELEKVTIGNSVTSIGDYAFSLCSIKEVVIPNSVIDIGRRAFSTFGLEKVIIGSSVAYIGEKAFGGNILGDCRLSYITCINCVPPVLSNDVFYGVDFNICVLSVPKGSKSAYLNATGWKDFNNIVEIDVNTITGIISK